MTRIDFSGVSDGFEPVPDGVYNAVLTRAEIIEQSKSSGQPYVKMEFNLTDEDYQGRKVWDNYSLQPQSLFALKRALVRLGAGDDMLNGEMDLEEVFEQLEDAECRLQITEREYEGKQVNDVKEILATEFAF